MSNIPQKLLSFMTPLLNRAKLGSLAGVTFEGARDLYLKLGYKKNLNFLDYFARYERGGIAGKVVDIFPSATWRNSPLVTSEDEKFEEDFNKLALRLKLFHYLERADRLSGIGHYGILMIGMSGDPDTGNPAQKLSSQEDIIFLSTFTEGNAKVYSLHQDSGSELFATPEIYDVSLFADIAGVSAVSLPQIQSKVHSSRIIHIAESLKEDEIFGIPRMQRIWNYLDDLDKTVGGSAEAVWLTADRGIQFDVDKDAQLNPEDLEGFSDEIDEYMHGMRRFIRTQGITANVLGSDVPNPIGAFNVITSLISGTIGVPKRVLFGSEMGQLASAQDEKNFNARVKERQEHFAEPLILRPFIKRLQDLGALAKVEYKIEWPDLSTLTKKDNADVAARFAQSVKNFSINQSILTDDEIRTNYLGLLTKEEAGVNVELKETEENRKDTNDGREKSDHEDDGKPKKFKVTPELASYG